MGRFLRWKYLLPRLALVSVLMLAVHYGLDPLLRWSMITSGEAAVGAKVEVAGLETSLRDGQLVFRNFAIANPNRPLRNLLQAELVRAEIDTNALLHKRLVVKDGTLQGLQFDTPRTTSGALPDAPEEEISERPTWLTSWTDSVGDEGAQWFEHLGDRLGRDLAAQLQTPVVAKELEQRWKEQHAVLRTQVESLRTQAKNLEQEIREIRKNPLRHINRLQTLQNELVSAKSQIESLRQELSRLPSQMEEDRRRIQDALEYDQRFVRQQLQFDQLDGDQLTQYLLGEESAQQLSTVLQWIGKARKLVPGKPKIAKRERNRGTNVLFHARTRPRLLIEHLSLQGTARLAGQPLGLSGSLTHVSSEPHLLSEPTRLELVATGDSKMLLQVVLDRREAQPRDTLHLECPQLMLPGRTLGNARKLAVEIAPGMASLQADIRLEADCLTGEIQFAQQAVQLTSKTGVTGKGRFALLLDKALAGIDTVEAKLVLSGTLHSPGLSLESDLGAKLAGNLNEGVKRLVEEQSEKLLAKSQSVVDAQLQALDQSRQLAQQELLAKLGDNQQLLSQLSALTGGSKGLSLPQLGSSLRSKLKLK